MQEFWVELDRLVRGNDLLDALYNFINGVDFKGFLGNNDLYVNIALAVFMILSFINCLFGYKLRVAWSTMECALAGGIAALYIVDEFWPMDKYLYTVLIACTAAVICAVLGYIIVRFEMAVRAGIYSGFLFMALFLSLKLDTLSIILGLAIGFIVAIVTAIMPRAMGIIYTAASGAIGVGASLAMFLFSLRVYNYLTYIGIGALTLIGIIIQGVSLHISKRRIHGAEETDETGMQHVSAGDNTDIVTEETEVTAEAAEEAAKAEVTEAAEEVEEAAKSEMTEAAEEVEEAAKAEMTEAAETVKATEVTTETKETGLEATIDSTIVEGENENIETAHEDIQAENAENNGYAAYEPIIITDEVSGNSSDKK
ncbi:MAG: TMEM198/TM7SF3 family protein [Lachnospiraceae bacterium]|nr:TMEM198/TM7SF3 family protein [Lachnospiraceae bacterium]